MLLLSVGSFRFPEVDKMDDLPRQDPEQVREAFREFLRRLAKAVLKNLSRPAPYSKKDSLKPKECKVSGES